MAYLSLQSTATLPRMGTHNQARHTPAEVPPVFPTRIPSAAILTSTRPSSSSTPGGRPSNGSSESWCQWECAKPWFLMRPQEGLLQTASPAEHTAWWLFVSSPRSVRLEVSSGRPCVWNWELKIDKINRITYLIETHFSTQIVIVRSVPFSIPCARLLVDGAAGTRLIKRVPGDEIRFGR